MKTLRTSLVHAINLAHVFMLLTFLSCKSNAQNTSLLTISSIEASGITRHGDHLIFVTDDKPGAYFKYGPLIPGEKEMLLEGRRLSLISIPASDMAYDLEGIDVLADGRVVLLSERLRMLIGEKGVIAHYDDALAEVGSRGLEGLAVTGGEDSSSMVAVLWEGGYFEYNNIPFQLAKTLKEDDLRRSFRPVVFVHNIQLNQSSDKKINVRDLQAITIQTETDSLEPMAQRFRAPDLVWHKINNNEWGFIILQNSENSDGQNTKYVFSRLQKYNLKGEPVGPPANLKLIVPQHLKNANWEGLGWFEDQKSLVLVHDRRPIMGTPTALVLTLDELWPEKPTAKTGIKSYGEVSNETLECSKKTPEPALYQDWKKACSKEGLTEKAFSDYLEAERPRVLKLKDPFTPIIEDKEERKKRSEIVLWEDDQVMVLIDKFVAMKPLVIPKKEMNFLTDASQKLQKHLASVAAVTSDAIRSATNNCNANVPIYIHPVSGIGIRQLHIHVESPQKNSISKEEFIARTSEYLKQHLDLR